VTYDPLQIGRTVRKLRAAAGLTQAELAERADLAFETISRIESGREPPSLRTAMALADAFGVSLDEVTGRRRAPARPETLLPEVRRLLTAVNAVEPTVVAHLTALALAVAGRRVRRSEKSTPKKK
jgi:transcriptional regulator with XRE-family HTH domain